MHIGEYKQISKNFDFIVEGNTVVIDGKGDKINFDIKKINSQIILSGIQIDNVIIKDAPNTEIISEDFNNIDLIIMDSPKSIISENSFHDFFVEEFNYSIIQVIRCDQIQITSNKFTSVVLNQEQQEFRYIDIIDTDNVLLEDNYFTELKSDKIQQNLEIEGIRLRSGISCTLINNNFESIFIDSFKQINFNTFQIVNYLNITLQKTVFSMSIFSSDVEFIFSFFNITSTDNPSNLDYNVLDNYLVKSKFLSESSVVEVFGIIVSLQSQKSESVNTLHIADNIFADLSITSNQDTGEQIIPTSIFQGIVSTIEDGNISTTIERNSYNTINFSTINNAYSNSTLIQIQNLNNTKIDFIDFQNIDSIFIQPISLCNSFNSSITFEFNTTNNIILNIIDPQYDTIELKYKLETIYDKYDTNAGFEFQPKIVYGYSLYTVRYISYTEYSFSDHIHIYQLDHTLPTISGVNIQEFNEIETNRIVSWFVSDITLDRVELYYNNELVHEKDFSSLTSYTIKYNVSTFDIGLYEFQIKAYDIEKNIASAIKYVRIINDGNPIIQEKNDLQISYNSKELLKWSVFDYNPHYFELFVNNKLVNSSTWDNTHPIIYEFQRAKLGFYTIFLSVNDTLGQESNQTVLIEVVDDLAPVITGNSTFKVEIGQINATIMWNINDLQSFKYGLYKEEELLTEGKGISGNISLNVEIFDLGQFNYTIKAKDYSGNDAKFTTTLLVIDNTIPEISGLEMRRVTENEYLDLSWKVRDNNPGIFYITRDAKVVANSTWSERGIRYHVNTNIPGIYNYTIYVYDRSDNSASFSTLIQIDPLNNAGETSVGGPSGIKINPIYIGTVGVFVIVIAGVKIVTKRRR